MVNSHTVPLHHFNCVPRIPEVSSTYCCIDQTVIRDIIWLKASPAYLFEDFLATLKISLGAVSLQESVVGDDVEVG